MKYGIDRKYLWILGLVSCLLPGCKHVTDHDQEIVDECPDNPNKLHPGICGCDVDDVIDALTGIYTCLSTTMDLCPNDPSKEKPGICGCGVADTLGPDGVALCLTQNFDLCPEDPNKTLPGICGCGISDTIDSTTGVASCLTTQIDLCPDDPDKSLPGVCGCGVTDTPDPETGLPLCTIGELDFCPLDPNKTKPGICGCGIADVDTDEDGKLDCEETCINNRKKFEPGICGCDILDTTQNIADNDKDGEPNCKDFCPDNPWKKVDDSCACDELHYELQGISGCAKILATADDFITFRDTWNSQGYGDSTNDMAFILVTDINLGEVLTQDSSNAWIGVGTEDLPFNALFLGNHHLIEAVRHNGNYHQVLTFGQDASDDVALFSHTSQARFYDLKVDIVVEGRDHVAALVAQASGTSVEQVEINGSVTGHDFVGGVIAEASMSTLSEIKVSSKITGSGQNTGGIAGQLADSQVQMAVMNGSVKGRENTGGISGNVSKASRLLNLYVAGEVSGARYTGGMVGMMTSRSSLLNAYATAQLTCEEAPCAMIAAQIGDFSTVKNAYTTGLIIDHLPPESDINPGDDDDPKDPADPDNPDDPEEDPAISVPIASLISSFGSVDNVVEHLYYWEALEFPSIPEEALSMSMVEKPRAFDYDNLHPYAEALEGEDSLPLIDLLNGILSCNLGVCTLDSYQCIQWTSELNTIVMPEDKSTLSVHLPVLKM